jgi:hypothetical protein
MVKKAALSVRITEATKTALDTEAAKEHRSTSQMVDLIVQDWLVSRLQGVPRRYSPDDQLAKGGRLLDLPLPNGKTLAECTFVELEQVGQAYFAAGESITAKAKALEKKLKKKLK